MRLSELEIQKVSNKNKPTFLIRRDERLTQIKPNYLNSKFETHFNHCFLSEVEQPIIKSVKDLAEKLREMNKRLDDSTFVYYKPIGT